MRICYELSLEYPEHLECCAPNNDEIIRERNAGNVQTETEAFSEDVSKITKVLDTFFLKTVGMNGEDLLDCMIKIEIEI